MTEVNGYTPEPEITRTSVDYIPDAPEEPPREEPWQVPFVKWVQNHFSTVEFLTTETKIRWCPTWWVHTEAVARLKALWAAHLALELSLDPAEQSNWWLHHWDPHRAVLFHDKGPFRNCDVDRGHLYSTIDKRVIPTPTTPPIDWEPGH